MANTKRLLILVGFLVALTGCSEDFGSPVTVSNRPLAEQLEERNAAAEADAAANVPEAVAFSEEWASGTFLRLDIEAGSAEAVLRSGPGDTFDVIAELSPGAEVLATGNQTGEWIHVLYAAFDGWIQSDNVRLGPADPSANLVEADEVEQRRLVYQVHGDTIGVNIRSTPDVSGDLVSGAPVGSLALGTGRTEGSWVELTYQGVTGWSSGTYWRPVSEENLSAEQRTELFGEEDA